MAPSAPPRPDHLLPFAPTTNVAVPAAGVRRKTPSELRLEQLTRTVRSRNSQDGSISALPSIGRPIEELCSIATAKDVRPPNSSGSAEPESQSGKFRDVTQLSSNTKVQASRSALDMAEALKVMAPAAGRIFSGIAVGPGIISQFPDSLSHIQSPSLDKLKRPPVDLSLKVSARFLSADSLRWCHRTSSSNEVDGVKLFVEKFEWEDKMDLGGQSDVLNENGRLDRFGARFCQALYSWVHPPPQYLELYEMALAGVRGDTKNVGIVTTLFRTWEDSFRSLYYMFCHKHCNIFYICTQQSVVMFERANSVEGSENGSHVYWSRSTRGLRKKLQEEGVEFLMPLYTSDGDMSTLEDLHELTEFEKLNAGHTRLMDPRTAIDKTSESLLFFDAGNVHRLFDFLLNYRFLLASGNGTDFPVLYSPVEFSKSSLYTPEVKCGRVRCPTENISKELPTHNARVMHRHEDVSAMSYSLELNGPPGAYITPWVIRGVCGVFQKSQKLGFEASFVTGPLSENLNVGKDSLPATKEVEGKVNLSSLSRTYPKDLPTSRLRVIRHLRYNEGFYQANKGGTS